MSTGGAPCWRRCSGTPPPRGDVLAYLVATVAGASAAAGTGTRLFVKFVDARGEVLYPNLPPQGFVNPLIAWAPGRQATWGAARFAAGNGPAQIWISDKPQGAQPLRKLIDFPPAARPRGITWSKEGDRIIVANQEYSGDIVMYQEKSEIRTS